jgi:hypothetical protein
LNANGFAHAPRPVYGSNEMALCARTDKLRCTEMTSTAGSVRQAQEWHQQMHVSVRPMPQATCCTKEINRGFSAPNGKWRFAEGGDPSASFTPPLPCAIMPKSLSGEGSVQQSANEKRSKVGRYGAVCGDGDRLRMLRRRGGSGAIHKQRSLHGAAAFRHLCGGGLRRPGSLHGPCRP